MEQGSKRRFTETRPTNTGFLLHFHSHTDKRYKDCLIKTMVHRAHALSSTTEAFNQECDRLRSIFTRLDYPMHVINSTINNKGGQIKYPMMLCAKISQVKFFIHAKSVQTEIFQSWNTPE